MVVSIPKRVSEALNLADDLESTLFNAEVSIPKRVSEALNLLALFLPLVLMGYRFNP